MTRARRGAVGGVSALGTGAALAALGGLAGALMVGPDPVPAGVSSVRRAVANPSWSVVEMGFPQTMDVSSGHARADALEQRARLRAYEGAPPVVPHETAGIPVHTCRACHARGVVAGARVGRPASHTYLVNCTQCHVEAASSAFPVGDEPDNDFAGWRSPGLGGDRFGPETPPTIPHPILMRNNCISCHGPLGYQGLRTDHPQRLNCVQCHVPQAEFDQLSPLFGTPAPPAPGSESP